MVKFEFDGRATQRKREQDMMHSEIRDRSKNEIPQELMNAIINDAAVTDSNLPPP